MVRLVVADENLMLLQIRLAVNFDLDLSSIAIFFFSELFRSQMRFECNSLNM